MSLAVATGRWVPAFLVLLVWVGFTCSAPGPSRSNVGASFAGVVIASIWVAAGLGNFDDTPHRELLAAASGSPGRHHRSRALASGTVMALAVIPVTAGCVLTGTDQPRLLGPSVPVCGAVGLAGVLIGVGIGTWLHRPVLVNRAVMALAAVAATIVTVVLPPVQAALRAVSDGRDATAFVLLAGAAGWATLSVGAASGLAPVRAR